MWAGKAPEVQKNRAEKRRKKNIRHEKGRTPMMIKSGKKGRAAGFFAGKMGKAKVYIRAQNAFYTTLSKGKKPETICQ